MASRLIAARSRGFTLVEILVAMTIVIILTTILAMGLGGSKDKAANKASKALVQKVKVALEAYFAEFRDYPPDGYDIGENGTGSGWNVTTQGVQVGFQPARRVRGTAALIYFLCRPVIKATRISSDPGDKTMNYERVGPFLQLDTRDFSLESVFIGGQETNFDPNYPWSSTEFWDTQGGINCEIVDAYRRPLCYDKVKTNEITNQPTAGKFKYFHPDLFQNQSGGSTGTPPLLCGVNAHPDAQRYIIGGLMPISEDEEPAGFINTGASATQMINSRWDPRFTDKNAVDNAMANESAAPVPPNGTQTTVKPRNVPGYDLWSAGKSWVDPRDDITSWGD
ncbi:MAG: type II secretion system protein [Planctomycetota bacterium]